MAKRDHAAGAAKSLNKTISEIMEHMGDDGPRPNAGLREFVREMVGDLAESWFKMFEDFRSTFPLAVHPEHKWNRRNLVFANPICKPPLHPSPMIV